MSDEGDVKYASELSDVFVNGVKQTGTHVEVVSKVKAAFLKAHAEKQDLEVEWRRPKAAP